MATRRGRHEPFSGHEPGSNNVHKVTGHRGSPGGRGMGSVPKGAALQDQGRGQWDGSVLILRW